MRQLDVSTTRRRLTFLLRGAERHIVTIDRELDTPAYREKIADALLAERWQVKTPRGPEPRPAPGISPYLTSE